MKIHTQRLVNSLNSGGETPERCRKRCKVTHICVSQNDAHGSKGFLVALAPRESFCHTKKNMQYHKKID